MHKFNHAANSANDNLTLFDLEAEVNRIRCGEVSFSETVAFIAALQENGSHRDNANQSMPGAEYTQAEILTDALAMCPANTFDDLVQKVEAWIIMSPETSIDAEQASCCELLAHSIMKDIHRLAK